MTPAPQASNIPIARLLPPLKKRGVKKRLEKVVDEEPLKERRASGKGLEPDGTLRRGFERSRSRERCTDLKEKPGPEKLLKKGFGETEECSALDQPSRENLVALVQQSEVFDEVATRRELHFLIRSLIR